MLGRRPRGPRGCWACDWRPRRAPERGPALGRLASRCGPAPGPAREFVWTVGEVLAAAQTNATGLYAAAGAVLRHNTGLRIRGVGRKRDDAWRTSAPARRRCSARHPDWMRRAAAARRASASSRRSGAVCTRRRFSISSCCMRSLWRRMTASYRARAPSASARRLALSRPSQRRVARCIVQAAASCGHSVE